MFGNYLNILKLVFIWTNLDIKPVLKKINFKLILFHLNFFSFYFLSPHYYSFHFTLINSFSINLDNCLPSSSTTVRRWLLPTTAGNCWLPPSAATDYRQRPHRPPLFVVAAHPVLYCLPSLATIVFHRSPCLSMTVATTHRCQLPLPIAAIYYRPSLLIATVH